MIASAGAAFECAEDRAASDAAEREMFWELLSRALAAPEERDRDVLRFTPAASATMLAGIEAAWHAAPCGGSRWDALEAFTNRVLGAPEMPTA
jgi:hypothetical protein